MPLVEAIFETYNNLDELTKNTNFHNQSEKELPKSILSIHSTTCATMS